MSADVRHRSLGAIAAAAVLGAGLLLGLGTILMVTVLMGSDL